MNKLFIHDLRITTFIGLLPWERRSEQEIFLNIEMSADFAEAIKNDALKYTIDYAKVAEQVRNFVKTTQLNLIETLADKIADLILKNFSVEYVKIEIKKPSALPEAKYVGFVLEKKLTKA